jgi:UDP-N-acetylglucosamine--N-acetylmuramyl-(pentapeptide) pyrophosphoryl-undecaprenol N-acetylglucosamine transferase
LKREAPDVVLGMGGYVSVPVGLAAVSLGIPVVLHEQNSRAGLANRLLSRWADAVGTSFDETEGLARPDKMIWTGLPLRPDLLPRDPAEARRSLELSPEDMTVLVFGGSQGARALNRLLSLALPILHPFRGRWQFIHLTGEAEFPSVKALYKAMGWKAFVRSYWPDMATLYAAADFVVSRSGANTVMELARMGKRALLVPFPHATDDHQAHNARFLEKVGLGTVVLEKDLNETRFAELLRALPPKESLRAENQARLARTPAQLLDAPGRVADLLEKTVAGRTRP